MLIPLSKSFFGYALFLSVVILIKPTESKDTGLGFVKTEEGCICYLVYAPICGTDGITYGNDCFLRCAQRQKYVLGVCKGECPCCKEPYHNEPFPLDIPIPTTSEGGSNDGWGWNSLGSSYSNLGRLNLGSSPGLGFPYWSGGYSPSVSYPTNINGKGTYVQIVATKSGKKDDGDANISHVVSSPELLAEPATAVVINSKSVDVKKDSDNSNNAKTMKQDLISEANNAKIDQAKKVAEEAKGE